MRKITDLTRRNVLDTLRADHVSYFGRLSDEQFLARIYDLDSLPSQDGRFKTARQEILQHRLYNNDWDDDWVFDDGRFQLLSGPDELFLQFLCMVVHPVVRPDADESAALVEMFNEHIVTDGWQIQPANKTGGKQSYVSKYLGETDEANAPGPIAFEYYARNPDPLIATITSICDAGGQSEISEILRSAVVSIRETGYDNWNGGTTSYALLLEIAPDDYARVQESVERCEAAVLQLAQRCTRQFDQDYIATVQLQPALAAPPNWRFRGQPISSTDALNRFERIWTAGCFRLFLSHTSKHKAKVTELRTELATYGICGFVAHKDIEPTEDWKNEILAALESAHALLAVLTPDFPESNWTDQEIGIAIGRKLPALPAKIGIDPYGFLASRQGIPGWLENTGALARDIARSLARNKETSENMKEALVHAVEHAKSFDIAREVCCLARDLGGFTHAQLARILRAAEENSQVKFANHYKLGPEMVEYVYSKAPDLRPKPVAHSAAMDPDYDPFEEA